MDSTTRYRLFIGIDPGLTGAIAVLDGNGKLVEVYDAYVAEVGGKKEMDMRRTFVTMESFVNDDHELLVTIEWAASSPQMGVTSSFNYGRDFGAYLMAIAALSIPHQKVRPAVWKVHMLAGYPKPEKKGDKSSAIACARALWPTAPLGKNKAQQSGRAEAMLIAEYGRRKAGGA
jgi:crossover junction endodeoxyribonuclease RuvC